MSILPPPPHPRSWRPPPPPPLLYQALAEQALAEQARAEHAWAEQAAPPGQTPAGQILARQVLARQALVEHARAEQALAEHARAEQALAETREELPAEDLVPDPSASAAAPGPSDVAYDFGDDDLATTPYQSDYPPPDPADYRRSWPIIPPAPLPNITPEQPPVSSSSYSSSNYSSSTYSSAKYSSWPPTVLEARANLASWSSIAMTSWDRFLAETKVNLARAAWHARWLASRARSWLLDRWAGVDEGHKGWMRAKAPYAAGLVIVATSMFSIGRTFEPGVDESGSENPASLGSSPTAEANVAATNQSGVAANQASVDRGAGPSPAALSLPPVPGVSPSPDKEAPILVGLAENLSAEGRDAEAVPVLERALARNADLTDDPAFLRALKRTALSEDRTAAAAAYALLTGPMGERGAEILYEISISPAARRGVRERAAYYVYTKDFEHKAPLPLYAAFKLLSAPTCEAKKSLLPFAAEAGGRHALDYLLELDKRKICSLDDFDNCYPCMNTDEELPETITKIETRLGT